MTTYLQNTKTSQNDTATASSSPPGGQAIVPFAVEFAISLSAELPHAAVLANAVTFEIEWLNDAAKRLLFVQLGDAKETIVALGCNRFGAIFSEMLHSLAPVAGRDGRHPAILQSEGRSYELRVRRVVEPNSQNAWLVILILPDPMEVEHRLSTAPRCDVLTGLPDRSALTACERLWGSAEYGIGRAGVFFVDLNEFKRANDRFGHRVGDRILCMAAERLRSAVRPHDLVVRYGGDEFVVVATDVENEAIAHQIASRIEAAFRQPFTLNGNVICVSASVGFAIGAPGELCLDDLIDEADRAMFRVKKAR